MNKWMREDAHAPARSMSRGFTLIELLVVIGIIGILSSIVLNSLSSARSAAWDSKVKSQLSSIRGAAEIYYVSNGNYGATTTTCTSGMFQDSASGLKNLSVSANYPTGENTIQCNSAGTSYAVSDNLYATGTYWCVDNTGTSKQESTMLGTTTASTTCP